MSGGTHKEGQKDAGSADPRWQARGGSSAGSRWRGAPAEEKEEQAVGENLDLQRERIVRKGEEMDIKEKRKNTIQNRKYILRSNVQFKLK